MGSRKLEVTPCRIVPCDIGENLSDRQVNRIREWVGAAENWEITANHTSDLAVLEARYAGPRLYEERSTELSAHVFDDGVCVFCLYDYTDSYADFSEYDPEQTLERRFAAHDELLAHEHECSDSLSEMLTGLRAVVGADDRRFTASPDWESGGLSYVFTFYFVDVDFEHISDETLHDKLVFLLFSEEARQTITHAATTSDDAEEVKRRYRDQFREELNQNYESLPQLHTCASWSTVLILGDITQTIVDDYRRMEINLQRTWFFTYITGKFIQHSLSQVSERTSKSELDRLDRILTTMMNQVATYNSINQSTLTTRQLELYNMLRDTSRLDKQIETVREQADIARQRYNWLLDEKRTRVNKRVDFALFVIAIVTVVSEYRALLELGIALVPVAIGVLSVSIYFFTPLFRGEI